MLKSNHFSSASESPKRVYDALALMPSLGLLPLEDRFDCTVLWWRVLTEVLQEQGQEPLALEYVDSDQPRLWLPMLRENPSTFKLNSLSNFYTSFFSPMLDPTADHQSLAMKAVELLLQQPWAVFDCNPIQTDAVFWQTFAIEMRNAGHFVKDYFRFRNWYLPVQGSFSDYLSGRPIILRKTLERRKRKIEREGGFEFKVFRDEIDYDQVIADYQAVYDRSWKPKEQYADFVPSLIRNFGAQGKVKLGFIYHHKKPIATQLWFLHQQKAAIYKLAYDKNYRAYSPGSLLTEHLLAETFAEGCWQEVDYLMGDEPYKKDWMTHCRQRHGLRVYRAQGFRGLATKRIAQLRSLLSSQFLSKAT